MTLKTHTGREITGAGRGVQGRRMVAKARRRARREGHISDSRGRRFTSISECLAAQVAEGEVVIVEPGNYPVRGITTQMSPEAFAEFKAAWGRAVTCPLCEDRGTTWSSEFDDVVACSCAAGERYRPSHVPPVKFGWVDGAKYGFPGHSLLVRDGDVSGLDEWARRRADGGGVHPVKVIHARDHVGGIRGEKCEVIVDDYSGVLDGASRGEDPEVAIVDGKPMSYSEFTEFLVQASLHAWGAGPAPSGFGPSVLGGAARAVREMELLGVDFGRDVPPCPQCAGGGIVWDTDADDHEIAEPCWCPAGVAVAEQEAAFVPVQVEASAVDNASPVLRRLLASDSLPVREAGATFREAMLANGVVLNEAVPPCPDEVEYAAEALALWQQVPGKCVKCSNTGRVVVDDVLGPGYEITGPCSCGRGRDHGAAYERAIEAGVEFVENELAKEISES